MGLAAAPMRSAKAPCKVCMGGHHGADRAGDRCPARTICPAGRCTGICRSTGGKRPGTGRAQLSRKLAAARAEVRRYQTRMFAFERTLLALKHDNAELEAACEQAWEQLEQANARAEKAEAACRRAEAALAAMQQTAPETPAQPDTAPEAVPQCEAAPEQPAPETEESLCAPEQALPPEPVQPAWQPETRLEQMAAELMGWFDAMMPQE